MAVELIIILLISVGGLLVADLRLPRWDLRSGFRRLATSVEELRPSRAPTAKEYVQRIDGTKKEGLISRSFREARQVYDTIGQSDRYQNMLQIALLCGALGVGVGGVMLRNWMLSVVLGVGFYFLPMWASQFALYRYQTFLSDELETALSLITTSYLRCDDILGAVKENLPHINEPVREVFSSFCTTLEYLDANAPAAIEKMKGRLDDTLFRQWCDTLILCQENHLLQAALPGIVAKFSDLKAQKESNETRMMLPLQQAIGMICLVLSFLPLMWMVNDEWYRLLTQTFWGQIAVVSTAVAVLVALNKAIRLSRPLTYDV